MSGIASGLTTKGSSRLKKKHFKPKHQKAKLFRANEPLLSVFMWGVNHTCRCRAVAKRVFFLAYSLSLPPGNRAAASSLRVAAGRKRAKRL
ncbi:hypothetical protein MRX96_024317 [Rhipicephalus microplus]